MVPSFKLLVVLVANWCGSIVVGRQVFKCGNTSLSKHFAIIGVSKLGSSQLGWHDDGSSEALRDNCLGQGQVENVCEDPSQLPSTGSKHVAWYSPRACRLSYINPVQGGAHVRAGGGERHFIG